MSEPSVCRRCVVPGGRLRKCSKCGRYYHAVKCLREHRQRHVTDARHPFNNRRFTH